MHDQVRCTISFNSEVFILHNIIKAFHLNQSVQWFLDKQFIFCSDIVIVSIILLTKIILYQNVKHFILIIGICNPPCQHRGICVAPQLCKCKPGYYGDQCEKGLHFILNFTLVSIKFMYINLRIIMSFLYLFFQYLQVMIWTIYMNRLFSLQIHYLLSILGTG